MKPHPIRLCIAAILVFSSAGFSQTQQELQDFIDAHEFMQSMLEDAEQDSILIDEVDGLVLIRFYAHPRTDFIHVAWSRDQGVTPVIGLEGSFWCYRCDGVPIPTPVEAADIVVSNMAFIYLPCAPQSPAIASIEVEGSPILPFPSDGDLWVTTWADDDNLYASWGDGFGVAVHQNRTDCGIAKFTGTLPDISAEEVCWKAPTAEPDVNDKPSSLLYFDNRLYGQFHSPLGDARIGYLAHSDDYGQSWTRVGFFEDGTAKSDLRSPWTRDNASPFRCLFFINMGQSYEWNTDGFAYGLGIGMAWSWRGGVFLTRVSLEDFLDYSAYEYFVGLDDIGPRWSENPSEARALPGVHTMAKGSALFHPGTGRYLFFTGKALYDAPEPWGPWTFAGAWGGALSPEEWRGGYMPAMISKDLGSDYFWFAISGQNYPPLITYKCQLGKMVMIPQQSTGIVCHEEETNPPDGFTLEQNYPNPFNPVTRIRFRLPTEGHARLSLSDASGRIVRTLLDRRMASGYHSLRFDGSDCSSGVYFYTLQSGEFIQRRKCLLLK